MWEFFLYSALKKRILRSAPTPPHLNSNGETQPRGRPKTTPTKLIWILYLHFPCNYGESDCKDMEKKEQIIAQI